MNSAEKCSACGDLSNGWVVENAIDGSGPPDPGFPPSFQKLSLYRELPSGDIRQILHCDSCGLYCIFTRSMPGGSLDALRTYIVQSVKPLSDDEFQELIHPRPSEVEVSLRCPRCKSDNAERSGGGAIGGEVFFSYQCNNCGFTDTVDEYQMPDWFS